jgi:Tol biopolymer transport system component
MSKLSHITRLAARGSRKRSRSVAAVELATATQRREEPQMRARKIFTALAAAGALVALTAIPASAKVAGANGRIAFARDDGFGNTFVYTANANGSHLQALLPDTPADAPHWSPDGSLLEVSACLDAPICDTAATIVNPDTGDVRGFGSPDPDVSIFCGVWAPSGTRLACEGHGNSDPSLNGIYSIRVSDSGGLSRITSISDGGVDSPIDYSPSGRQLVFARTDPSGPPHQNCALFVVTLGSGAVQQITPWGFCDDDGSWSPDGSKIIFEHFGSLYTVYPDGSHLVRLPLKTGSATTSFTAFDAGWSPSGGKIVFAIRTKTSAGQTREGIGTANADGSNVQLVTASPTRDAKPDWGPHPLATS